MVKPQIKVHLLLFILLFQSPSWAWICGPNRECGSNKSSGGGSPANATSPVKGNKVRINPSAVPLERGYGAEVITFKNSFDFSLTRGLGRVGAAISPSNSEETFFGPPGFESPTDFEARKRDRRKYESPKYTLATAFGLLNNKKSGLKRFEVNLGVMGKYNRDTKAVTPGGGLSGVAGPFTFGYALYGDESQVGTSVGAIPDHSIVRYAVETFSIGIFLESLAIDHSRLLLFADDTASVAMTTATLFLKRVILTASLRSEDSDRPIFNYGSNTIETKRKKGDLFLGFQYRITDSIMIGLFNNYYLLREWTLGATVFI